MSNNHNEPIHVETTEQRESRMLGVALIPFITAALIGAIGFKLFGSSIVGWIGAAIGFIIPLFSAYIRDTLFEVVVAIVGFFVLIGIVFFIFSTFFGEESSTTIKSSKPISSAEMNQSLDPSLMHPSMKLVCDNCTNLINSLSDNPEGRNRAITNCNSSCGRYGFSWK